MIEYDRTADRLRLRRPETRWLTNGVHAGTLAADAAHNITVSEGFDLIDPATYIVERIQTRPNGPTLLIGVTLMPRAWCSPRPGRGRRDHWTLQPGATPRRE